MVTDQSVSLPVMRPLIAMDKVDIMDKAQEIGTYETSIQPYEDCCTVFLPKHPVTKPKLDRILASESKLDCEKLIADAGIGRDRRHFPTVKAKSRIFSTVSLKDNPFCEDYNDNVVFAKGDFLWKSCFEAQEMY